MIRTVDLLDLRDFEHASLFEGCEFPWQALGRIAGFVRTHLKPANYGRVLGAPLIGAEVLVGEGTVVEHGAVIKGPAIIGRNCRIAAGAYVRENVIVGDGCVLGNSSEFKNALLLNEAQAPHFNYVGDSILGAKAHLGAGAICSNLKSLAGNVTVAWQGQRLDTGLRKFGAVVGDGAEVGCNCVLNPGSIIGRNSILYPLVNWRGVCPPGSVVKLRQQQEVVAKDKPQAPA